MRSHKERHRPRRLRYGRRCWGRRGTTPARGAVEGHRAARAGDEHGDGEVAALDSGVDAVFFFFATHPIDRDRVAEDLGSGGDRHRGLPAEGDLPVGPGHSGTRERLQPDGDPSEGDRPGSPGIGEAHAHRVAPDVWLHDHPQRLIDRLGAGAGGKGEVHQRSGLHRADALEDVLRCRGPGGHPLAIAVAVSVVAVSVLGRRTRGEGEEACD